MARGIGWSLCAIFGIAIGVALGDGFESSATRVGMLLWAAVVVFFLVRSFFWGIYVGERDLLIVSWVRTYRVRSDDIEAIYDQSYNYLLNGGAGSVTLLSSRTRVIGFELESIGRRIYPGTIASNSRQKELLDELAVFLEVPVVRLEGWDSARWFC